ncbi:MAG: 5-(carboxyamino)imidazole ribonucleotide synthase [Acidobacteriota bacterium]|nr:5-(carboxyamino)imidazole ribonucleotide synthase [Acidobacteriota bacterium]
MKFPVLPGATVGVLGSGQLGRMFAIAARRMGYRVHTLSPDEDTPTGQVADVEINASYEDLDEIKNFAAHVDVVTFEFENVPAATAEAASKHAPVRPSGEILHITQHRLREKTFLAKHGFPVTRFEHVRSLAELQAAFRKFDGPAILKTAGFGYDGKGQVRIAEIADAEPAWDVLKGQEAVLEAVVDFECELSIVAARDAEGAFVHYGVSRNDHLRGILDVSTAPAPIPPGIVDEAVGISRSVMDQLNVVGVLCVELFLTRSGKLLVNELAPRPHNSGHWTIDACITSQFEQQLRSVCGLPLGATTMLTPAAMANLLGDLWQGGEPDWAAVCRHPEVKLHLYGKLEPRPGRKMGHLTATAHTALEAERIVRAARGSASDHSISNNNTR